MNPCPSCGHPVSLRIGFTIHCGNPACKRFDERLEGVEAGSPAIGDAGERERMAKALTPPGWVRWVSGLMFLILPVAMLYGQFLLGWPAGWWKSLLPTLPFGVVGVLILFSGSAGRRIAAGTKAEARLRGDANLGCGFGLIAGIGSFAAFSLIVSPILDWGFGIRALFGIPLMECALILLVVVGGFASLWGRRRARVIRKHAPGE